MKEVPEHPTTEELRDLYPYIDELHSLADKRWRVSEVLGRYTEGLVAIVGPCAMTDNSKLHQHEALQVEGLEKDGITTVYRAPVWKPRTNPNDWHGLETTNPETAYSTLVSIAREHSNPAIELALPHHVGRYANMLAFGWIGSRNAGETDTIRVIAKETPRMPLGIKNSMDGSVEDALTQIGVLDYVRTDSNAPSVLIFRGGSELRNPEAWEEAYRYAHDQTGGKIIVDTAHGSEMAHDPNGNFKKSRDGQQAALEHVIDIVQCDPKYAPAGIMIEAGEQPDVNVSPTDPLLPLDIALQGVKRLYRAKVDAPVVLSGV